VAYPSGYVVGIKGRNEVSPAPEDTSMYAAIAI
jgi:hypothetical protein